MSNTVIMQQTADATSTVAQLSRRFDILKSRTKIGIAIIVQELQIRGLGKMMLLRAIDVANVERDDFFTMKSKSNEAVESLISIATADDAIVGCSMSVDQMHYVLCNKGIVV